MTDAQLSGRVPSLVPQPRDREAAQILAAKLHAVIRDLRPIAMHTDSCVTTHTPTEQLYAYN